MAEVDRELTYRQKAFVREFVRLGNVLQAARAAGVKGAESAGYRMMRNAKVQAAIKAARDGTEARLAGETAKALRILLDLMENAATDSVRLRAVWEDGQRLWEGLGSAAPSPYDYKAYRQAKDAGENPCKEDFTGDKRWDDRLRGLPV